MKKISTLTFYLIILTVFKSFAVSSSDIVGIYEFLNPDTEEKAIVKIYELADEVYNARVIWAENIYDENGLIRLDKRNPNKSLRNTPANRILLISDLKFNEEEERWESDYFYHPIWGKVFDVHIFIESAERIAVHAFWKRPSLGKTIFWDRVEDPEIEKQD